MELIAMLPPKGRSTVPSWTVEDKDFMRVPHQIANCVSFLGTPTTRGFSLAGTAFAVCCEQEDFEFVYLLTAQHVLWPDRSRTNTTPPDTQIWIRHNVKSGAAAEAPVKVSDWYFAERGIDLAVLPLNAGIGETTDSESKSEVAVLNLDGIGMTDERIRDFGMGVGDEVFVAGAYIHHLGERRNIPIIRTGNIAAMPSEPISFASPRRPAYLIETRSLGGISGAPVFLNTESRMVSGPRREPEVKDLQKIGGLTRKGFSVPCWLIGMVLGTHSGAYPEDFPTEPRDVLSNVDLNSGISVVMPLNVIREFLETPALASDRQRTLDEMRKQSGYRPTSARKREDVSAGRISTPTAANNPENPSHKEDFTSLLGAATRKTKPSD